MTTYFIYMGEMRALTSLKRLSLLDEIPKKDFLVYDNVVLEASAKKRDHQHTLSECAIKICDLIDMEDFLQENFSVVVFTPTQLSPNRIQDVDEMPKVAVTEMLYVLQIQYELYRAFWSRGKYPSRLHIIFGEYLVFSEHIKDVFNSKHANLKKALWEELLPGETLKKSYQSDELPGLLQKAEAGKWFFLKELGLENWYKESSNPKNVSHSGEQTQNETKDEQSGEQEQDKLESEQKTALTGEEMQGKLYSAVLTLFRKISIMNAGRIQAVNELETTVSVNHMLQEKNLDVHEETRNEVMLFLYVFGGGWQASSKVRLSSNDANPENLVKTAESLSDMNEMRDRVRSFLQDKRRELEQNLRAIDPDRALRVQQEYSLNQQIRISEDYVQKLRDSLKKKEEKNGESAQSAQQESQQKEQQEKQQKESQQNDQQKRRKPGIRLLFQSVRHIKEDADKKLVAIKNDSKELVRSIQDFAHGMQGDYNAVKFNALEHIYQDIQIIHADYFHQGVNVDSGHLMIAKSTASRNIDSVQEKILNADFRRIEWPQDISKAVEDTEKKVNWLHKHMTWRYWLLRILAMVVFVVLFTAPYVWLSRMEFSFIPRLIALCVTAGAALLAYMVSAQVFLRRYKMAVENLVDDLAKRWTKCKSGVFDSADHFSCMLLNYVPNLFAQYHYSRRLDVIGELSDKRKIKITYHKKRLALQIDTIKSLEHDMDIHETGTKPNQEATDQPQVQTQEQAPQLDVCLDVSAVSNKNRSLYSLTPEEAKELAGSLKPSTEEKPEKAENAQKAKRTGGKAK